MPCAILLFGLPKRPAILGVLNDFAHGPVFGLFTVAVVLLLREQIPVALRYFTAFSISILLGGSIEWVQPLLGRDGNLRDWLVGALGAGAGLAALALATTHQRWLPMIVLAISGTVICMPVFDAILGYAERHRQAPALLELSNRADWYFLSIQGFQVTASKLPHRWRRASDSGSLRVKVTESGAQSITHLEPLADWRDYRWLKMDLTNPGAAPLQLTIRVHDRMHNNQQTDRFNRRFRLEPSTREVVAVALEDIESAPAGRILDISHVAEWIIFADADIRAGQEFYVTRVWLE
jgi:hypothetical protein